MSSANNDLQPGDRVRLVFDDAPQESALCTVTGFKSDTDLGLSPEVEDYVACWVELDAPDETNPGERRCLTLGTDFRYSLDGRTVTLQKV